MTDDKKTLTISIIALLIAMGIPAVDITYNDIFRGELKDYYVCDVTGELQQALRLSSTLYSAYPYKDSNVGAKYCKDVLGNKGIWIGIESYALSKGIDPYELLIQKEVISESASALQYLCTDKGCYEKK